MGLFRRRRPAAAVPPEPPVPDPEFAFLSAEQGTRMRAQVRKAFAEHGLEVEVRDDRVLAHGGIEFGLHNLAARCRAEDDERSWARVISEHVEAVVRAANKADDVTELSHEELLSRTYLRVLGTSTLPHLHDYSRPLAGDLVESIAVDCPDTVLTPSEELVAEHGADAMREAGLLNVLAEPIESHEALDLPGGGVVHVASGSSVYVASKLLVLPDVLRRTIGESDVPYGVLVAVPFRHQLFFHVLVDSTAVAAIDALVSLAATGYGEGVGPVSPYVYWWRDGAPLTQVSFRGEDDQLHVRIGPELDEVLGILSRRPPGK